MPGFDIAIVLDSGLFFVEEHDGDGVLRILGEILVRGGAQPVRGGIGIDARRKPAEGCGERDSGERRECGDRDRFSYFWQIAHFAERFERRHWFSPC